MTSIATSAAVEVSRLVTESHRLLGTPGGTGLTPPPDSIEEISDGRFWVAVSPAMHRIRLEAEQVANLEAPLLVLGETGTGKEVLAYLIHKLSRRARRNFLKVNCAALPAELLESELFGYEAGAFTGASRHKPGKFELCDQGTILLDEIAEIPPSLQAKLLHVLQDQEFTRLGGRTRVKVDVRVLAATNMDVQQALASGRLREDIFYRLSAYVFHLPALRERLEDVPVLLAHFIQQAATRYGLPPLPISERLIDRVSRYAWPGNVRELENFAKRYLLLADEDLVLADLGPHARNGNLRAVMVEESCSGDLKSTLEKLKAAVEAEEIRRCLEQTNWNRRRAAR